MTHRFKRPRPLGGNKKSMKSENEESRRISPAVPESAEIFDFLYVDRARVSALYAQLFPQGVLTNVKTTASQSFSDDKNIGSDIKVIKAEAKSSESGSEGIERMFDATWSVPLDVLDRLKSLSLVKESLRNTGLGSIVLEECFIRVIDFSSMKDLFEPAMRAFFASGHAVTDQAGTGAQAMTTETLPVIADAFKAMPQSIHAHFLTDGGFLWSSLQSSGLTIPVTDLTLKYGGTVSGRWKLLYLVDAWADSGSPPDVSTWSGGPLIDGTHTAIHGLRTMMGRPQNWIGITPLMIFRSTVGWRPPVSGK
jgi:hypothetical protein